MQGRRPERGRRAPVIPQAGRSSRHSTVSSRRRAGAAGRMSGSGCGTRCSCQGPGIAAGTAIPTLACSARSCGMTLSSVCVLPRTSAYFRVLPRTSAAHDPTSARSDPRSSARSAAAVAVRTARSACIREDPRLPRTAQAPRPTPAQKLPPRKIAFANSGRCERNRSRKFGSPANAITRPRPTDSVHSTGDSARRAGTSGHR